MKLDVYNTHMELYPYKKGDYPVIEKMYTAIDKFSGMEKPCGYIIENNKLFLPRGTSISTLEFLCGTEAHYFLESDPIDEMSQQFYSLYDPRDQLQKDSIKFLKSDLHQLGLNLGTGIGKSYVTAYASTELKQKTLIITPSDGLKQQWISTYHKMFDYQTQNLVNIASSAIMKAILEDTIVPADVYFVNHQTLHSFLSQYGGTLLKQFFQKLKIGIKVYDEAHIMFDNILLIDFYSNTNRTWYLTATFDRSDKTESVCFKQAFSSMCQFGEEESILAIRKHIIYHIVNINSRISPKDRAKVIGYAGCTAASYGKYAFFRDPNQTMYNTIVMLLKKIENVEGKTLIFVPLIDAVDEVVKKLKEDFPTKSIAPYHSRCDKEEKEAALKKDIIVSTIKSCGTGRDIPGLRCVICAEPIASRVLAKQMIGRLRPYSKDKNTYFFDVIDRCLAPLNWWFNARFKVIQTLVKEVVYLNMEK